MPGYVCGPAAKVELEFWGIPDTIIERCCYSHYNAFNSTLKALNRLEKDRYGSFDFQEESHDTRNVTKWHRFRRHTSLILIYTESPTSTNVNKC
jgi:hypothetical protein